MTIEAQKTIELIECGTGGVQEVRILKQDTSSIEFDRFMRLKTVAEHVNKLNLEKNIAILDVGGFDGAFALFVPGLKVMVIDPQTTGGSGLNIPFPNKHFDVVVSIDALEHLPRKDRPKLLQELVRVTRSKLFVNFPEAGSMNAQKTVLSVISNKFIQEHVDYDLPKQEETVSFLKEICPSATITATGYVNISTWLPWFILFHTDKKRGLESSEFLKEQAHAVNPPFLYYLLECDLGGSI